MHGNYETYTTCCHQEYYVRIVKKIDDRLKQNAFCVCQNKLSRWILKHILCV